MTPKEKAKKLVDDFHTIDSDAEMYDDFKMPIFYAQRCALIAVDEIIWLLNNNQIDIDYYQEVKQEINGI